MSSTNIRKSASLLKLIEEDIPEVQAKIMSSTRNKIVSNQVCAIVENMEKLLNRLKNLEVEFEYTPKYTIVHQVQTAMLLIVRLFDQYEMKSFSPPVIFSEVYNRQQESLLTFLAGIDSALNSCLVELHHCETSEECDNRVLQAVDLSSHYLSFNVINYALSISGSAPVLTLPSVLICAFRPTHPPPVFACAVHGQWNEVLGILNEDPAPLASTAPVYSLLHMAVFWQDCFAIAMLLGLRANIDACTAAGDVMPRGSTALHIAAALGNVDVLKLLICSGAATHIRNSRGQTAAMIPTSAVCATALQSASSLWALSEQLCRAAANRNSGELRAFLFAHDLPVNVRRHKEDPYLLIHHAAATGRISSCQLLIDRGASLLLRTSDGRLPSQVAQDAGHAAVARSLHIQEQQFLTLNMDKPKKKFDWHQAQPRFWSVEITTSESTTLSRPRSHSLFSRKISDFSTSSAPKKDTKRPPTRASQPDVASPVKERPSDHRDLQAHSTPNATGCKAAGVGSNPSSPLSPELLAGRRDFTVTSPPERLSGQRDLKAHPTPNVTDVGIPPRPVRLSNSPVPKNPVGVGSSPSSPLSPELLVARRDFDMASPEGARTIHRGLKAHPTPNASVADVALRPPGLSKLPIQKRSNPSSPLSPQLPTGRRDLDVISPVGAHASGRQEPKDHLPANAVVVEMPPRPPRLTKPPVQKTPVGVGSNPSSPLSPQLPTGRRDDGTSPSEKRPSGHRDLKAHPAPNSPDVSMPTRAPRLPTPTLTESPVRVRSTPSSPLSPQLQAGEGGIRPTSSNVPVQERHDTNARDVLKDLDPDACVPSRRRSLLVRIKSSVGLGSTPPSPLSPELALEMGGFYETSSKTKRALDWLSRKRSSSPDF